MQRTWNKVNITKESIVKETGKSVLLRMPANSIINDFSFWFPKKLIRIDDVSGNLFIIFPYTFTFEISNGEDIFTISASGLLRALNQTAASVGDDV